MKKQFIEFDAKHYKAMNCATCHGKKAVANGKVQDAERGAAKLPCDRHDQAGFMAPSRRSPTWCVHGQPRSTDDGVAASASNSGARPDRASGFLQLTAPPMMETAAKAADPAAMPSQPRPLR